MYKLQTQYLPTKIYGLPIKACQSGLTKKIMPIIANKTSNILLSRSHMVNTKDQYPSNTAMSTPL